MNTPYVCWMFPTSPWRWSYSHLDRWSIKAYIYGSKASDVLGLITIENINNNAYDLIPILVIIIT